MYSYYSYLLQYSLCIARAYPALYYHVQLYLRLHLHLCPHSLTLQDHGGSGQLGTEVALRPNCVNPHVIIPRFGTPSHTVLCARFTRHCTRTPWRTIHTFTSRSTAASKRCVGHHSLEEPAHALTPLH